jgi:predicted nucleic acid-binding Zn ribbon protein
MNRQDRTPKRQTPRRRSSSKARIGSGDALGAPRERASDYDNSEPAALGSVLSKLFAMRGFGRVQADRQLQQAWEQVAGRELAKQTRLCGLKNGVLQVHVSSSPLLSELAAFRKTELLDRIKNEFSQLRIRDLKFRLQSDLH